MQSLAEIVKPGGTGSPRLAIGAAVAEEIDIALNGRHATKTGGVTPIRPWSPKARRGVLSVRRPGLPWGSGRRNRRGKTRSDRLPRRATFHPATDSRAIPLPDAGGSPRANGSTR